MGDTNLSIVSEEKNISVLIQEILGDSHINYESLFFITVIYSIFLVIGVLGNLSTCIVILTNEYMRTATNVYLFNLAIADVATLVISMPSELYLLWRQYPWTFGDLACDAKIVVTEAIIYSSILTIVAFTCERYLAICHPLSPLSRSSTGKAKKIISWIWLVSFLSALPWALFTKVNYLVFNDRIVEESAWCSIPFNEEPSGSLYMMLGSTIIYFIVPMVVVTMLYTRIGLALHRSKMKRSASTGGEEEGPAEKNLSQGKKTVIKMLVVVVSSFFFCWSPFHSQRLMFVLVTLYGSWTKTLTSAQHILFVISGIFYYFNSVLNPILYSVMSKRFRRGFSDIRQNLLNKIYKIQSETEAGKHESLSPRPSSRTFKMKEFRPLLTLKVDDLDLATPTVLNTPLEDTKEESEHLIAAVLPATHPQQSF